MRAILRYRDGTEREALVTPCRSVCEPTDDEQEMRTFQLVERCVRSGRWIYQEMNA